LDISWYDEGLRLIPGGRTARLETRPDGRVVATSDTEITDEMVFEAIESGRR
jgi:hypothetical protein